MDTTPRQVLLLALVSLASYRAWKLVGHDAITEPLRDRLPEKLDEMVSCPWCLGTWTAFAATGAADWATSVWLPGFFALAAAALVGFLHRIGDA
jgi:hypothetical protein